LVVLPPPVPKQIGRRTQSNIPNARADREMLKREVQDQVAKADIVPPLSLSELREHAQQIVKRSGMDPIFVDYVTLLVNNETWRHDLAAIPYERRLLLVPKCLRVEERCPAPFDELGLLCRECGQCSLHDLTVEAERLGYAVLVAEGSSLVMQMIESGRIDAIVGVSCLNVLEKCFPHMEAAAIPGISIPLLQDDCANTTVDLEWVWDAIHLTSDDASYRLDLDAMKREVSGWFEPAVLDSVMGPADGETESIAREWLGRSGKRWRPFLCACVHTALEGVGGETDLDFGDAIKKLAVAVECFHKASLIHDDIEDGDLERYSEKTLHAEYGMPVALNVGDFLVGEGYRLIAEVDAPAETKVEMLRAAAQGHRTLSRGQGAELCWTLTPRPLKSLEVLEIFREKTAPAFGIALRLGALLARAEEPVYDVLDEYSEALGIAYQIRDDLEDFSGESDSNDLHDLRPSLLLAIALRRAEAGRETELLEGLWNRTQTYAGVETELLRIFEERGVVGKANDLLDAYEEQAVRSLSTLSSATLKGLLRRVIGKVFGQPPAMEGYCSEFEARNAASRPTRADAPA
jgi:geranylgeranyl pyrophosphate synthase